MSMDDQVYIHIYSMANIQDLIVRHGGLVRADGSGCSNDCNAHLVLLKQSSLNSQMFFSFLGNQQTMAVRVRAEGVL